MKKNLLGIAGLMALAAGAMAPSIGSGPTEGGTNVQQAGQAGQSANPDSRLPAGNRVAIRTSEPIEDLPVSGMRMLACSM